MVDSTSTRPAFPPPVIAVAVFVAAYLAVAAVAAVLSANFEFVYYLAVMVVLSTVVLLVHLRLRLPAAVLAALAIWGALHMAGGLVPVPESWPIDGEVRVLYSWRLAGVNGPLAWLKFDQLVHAYGFGVTAWLLWASLVASRRRRGEVTRPDAGLMVLIAAAACGFGALNEIVEFVATLLTETNVGGYTNTALDLIANLVGATVAVALIAGLDRSTT